MYNKKLLLCGAVLVYIRFTADVCGDGSVTNRVCSVGHRCAVGCLHILGVHVTF